MRLRQPISIGHFNQSVFTVWHALVTSREGAGAELEILAGEGLILTLMQFASLCLLFLYRIFE